MDKQKEKASMLDKAMDAIRGKHGTDTIVRGTAHQSTLNVGKKYKAQLENKKEK